MKATKNKEKIYRWDVFNKNYFPAEGERCEIGGHLLFVCKTNIGRWLAVEPITGHLVGMTWPSTEYKTRSKAIESATEALRRHSENEYQEAIKGHVALYGKSPWAETSTAA
jgi:hypothetical protein